MAVFRDAVAVAGDRALSNDGFGAHRDACEFIGVDQPRQEHAEKSCGTCVCVAEMGDSPFPIGAEDANNRFKTVGKRLKQLYKAEPSEYLVRLPASPALLLKEHPVLAKSLYSRDKLPCACPLSASKVVAAEAHIMCRVGKPLEGALVPKRKQAAAVAEQPQQLGMQQMQSMFMLMIQQFGRQMQQAAAGSQEQRAGVTFLPPGTLDASPPAVSKLQKLEADAFRSPSSGGSVVTDDDKPRSAALFAPVEAEASPSPEKGDAMRDNIVRARAALISERAKKAAEAKEVKAKAARAKAMKGKGKVVAKKPPKPAAKGKKKAVVRKSGDVPVFSSGKAKPASWLKKRPTGCATCRYIPGCKRSCSLKRGEAVPK